MVSYLWCHTFPSLNLSLCLFVYSPTAPKEPEVEVPWSEIESDVVHLTTDSFDSFLSGHPSVLAMFYAPCKSAHDIIF